MINPSQNRKRSIARFAVSLIPIFAFGALRPGAFGQASSPTAGGSGSADSMVELPQFTVSAPSTDRYQATDSASAARIRGQILDTPQSVRVVTRGLMDDLGAGRLIDSLLYIPGVNEGPGVGLSDRITLRCFASNG